MIQRATGPQCLSSRVSALADGSLPDDVRDRALAHVTSCPDCRADLEAERLLRARLQTLPGPRPSASLVASLLAMGEPGGPLPPRPGHVPGTPRPRPATIRREQVGDVPWHRSAALPSLPWHRVTPGRRSTSRSPELPARPGPSSHPGPPGRPRATRRRAVVGATAGAVGAGVIAAALASGLPAAPAATVADQVRAETRTVDVGTLSTTQPVDVSTGWATELPVALPVDLVTGQGVGQVGGVAGVELGQYSTGSSALPGVTTTLLHHLLASSATRSSGSAGSVLVARSRPTEVSHLAGERYLTFGYLAGPSR
jgi:Putative zinc-finger